VKPKQVLAIAAATLATTAALTDTASACEVKYHVCRGPEIQFNAAETQHIAAIGGVSGAATASGLVPLFYRPIVAALGYGVTELAKAARKRNLCLSVFVISRTIGIRNC
jgi:hypothetical protein